MDCNYAKARSIIKRNTDNLGLPIFLVALAFLLFWPVLIPIAIVQHLISEKQKLICAGKTNCDVCHKALGKESIERASTQWQAQFESMRHSHPNIRFRIVRRLHAVCTCGRQFTYNEKSKSFTPLEKDA